ncbi:T6SS effector BTH_I2691 family protein, partial [Pseudomonas sp. R5(2019)]|uniref:T6SS effector BTH_I2691 family protein n=1 Tax=Pseudomonas sp. R5(2019) TaxID=2697566 RepID=UPI00273EEC6B
MTNATAGGATSAPACSSRVPILPIRYAVVPRASDAPLYRYEASGFSLEQGFPALDLMAYTLRALRPGYVYVFMKGPKGEKLIVHEYDGKGGYLELKYSGLQAYGRRDRYRANGKRQLWVWADTCPDTAREVWIGYSPHLWTNGTTTQVSSDVNVRKRHMRPLDMRELTRGEKSPSTQPHVLPASAVRQWVEDYKPEENRMPLAWSSDFSDANLPLANLLAVAAHYPYTQPRVPVVVALNDAEGLCQDLSLMVAAYQHQARDLKPAQPSPFKPQTASAERPSIPACFRLDVEKLSAQSKDYHHQSLVATLLEQTLAAMYDRANPPPEQLVLQRAEYLRRQVGNRPKLSLAELRYQVLTDERLSPNGARLAKRIDLAKYQAFLAERESVERQLRSVFTMVDKACADHDQWLATAEDAYRDTPYSLAAALATYDRDELISAR